MLPNTPPPPPPPPAGGKPAPAATTPKANLKFAPRQRRELAVKLVCLATEGFGKTTLGAYAPNPLIVMTPGETGYDTLLAAGRAPQVPAVDVSKWEALLSVTDSLLADPQGIQTFVLDELGGAEQLCHDETIRTEYAGSHDKFMEFHKGYDAAARLWRIFLGKLERLNQQHGMNIVLLSHAKIVNYKNPFGPDYDRFVADVHEKTTWSETRGWADAVLFGTFNDETKDEKGSRKKKGVGGTERILYTERQAAFDAKNRFGMDSAIWLDQGPEANWSIIWNAIKGGNQ